jgi:hypothetical protein
VTAPTRTGKSDPSSEDPAFFWCPRSDRPGVRPDARISWWTAPFRCAASPGRGSRDPVRWTGQRNCCVARPNLHSHGPGTAGLPACAPSLSRLRARCVRASARSAALLGDQGRGTAGLVGPVQPLDLAHCQPQLLGDLRLGPAALPNQQASTAHDPALVCSWSGGPATCPGAVLPPTFPFCVYTRDDRSGARPPRVPSTNARGGAHDRARRRNFRAHESVSEADFLLGWFAIRPRMPPATHRMTHQSGRCDRSRTMTTVHGA